MVTGFDIHPNLAISSVLTAPTTPTAGTSLVLAAGEGARFPDPATFGAYNATVFQQGPFPTPLTAEVIRITARSGDTLTITRAQESTTARTILVGDLIVASVTKKTLEDIETAVNNKQPLDSDLTDIAALTANSDDFLQFKAGHWTNRSKTQVTADLNPVTTLLQGMMSAADKNKADRSYYDLVAQGGADPTGVTDCTTIFNAAITTVATLGGILYLPAGSFKVNTAGTALTANGNYVTIRGAGSVATQIVSNHATSDVITLSGNNCRIEYLRIIGTTSTTKTAGYAINITGANCSIFAVDLVYMWSGVKMTGQLARCDYMNIVECGRNAINGQAWLIDSFTDQVITNSLTNNGNGVGGVPNSAGHAGIRITNLSSLILQNMQVIHSTNCLDVTTSANTIPSIKATGCFFDSSAIGMNMVQTGTGVITRCEFTNVWYGSHSTAGVVLNGTNIDGIDMVDCEFYGSPFGIDAQLANEWTVRSSRFAGNTTNAIRTAASANHSFSITGNYIGTQAGFGVNAQGINVQTGAYERYDIVGNRGLETNTTPGIIDLGTVTLAWQKNVQSNIGVLSPGMPTTLATATATPAASTATLVPGTALSVPPGGLRIGSRIKFTLSMNKTGAGTLGVITIAARWGSAGTAADGAICSWTIPGTTAVADAFFGVFIVEVTALGSGTSATVKGLGMGLNSQTPATGYGTVVGANAFGTPAGFNSTLATTPNLSLSVSSANSSAQVWGFVEVVN